MTAPTPTPEEWMLRTAQHLRHSLGSTAEATARRWAEETGDRRWLAVAALLHDRNEAPLVRDARRGGRRD